MRQIGHILDFQAEIQRRPRIYNNPRGSSVQNNNAKVVLKDSITFISRFYIILRDIVQLIE